jgi:hypothetical protein
MGMPELTSDLSDMAGLSPKKVAAVAALRLYEKYVDYMAKPEGVSIDGLTAAVIISCTEEAQREAMWQAYLDERDKQDGGSAAKFTASVYAIGKWYQYMSNSMGLTERSTGGG